MAGFARVTPPAGRCRATASSPRTAASAASGRPPPHRPPPAPRAPRRSYQGDDIAQALTRGDTDLIGIGRPMLADPELPKRILAGEIDTAPTPEAKINLLHLLGWYNTQFEFLGDGLDPDLNLDGEEAVALFQAREAGVYAALAHHRRTAA